MDETASRAIELVLHLWPNIQGTRMMGSAALGLAYAACGRVDMYFHHNLSPWDVASGLLLVAEAGGVVTDKRANPATLYSEGHNSLRRRASTRSSSAPQTASRGDGEYKEFPMPYVAANGLNFYYETYGDPGSPPVLLISGLGGDHRGWRPLAEHLAASFRVIVFDNRDSGLSQAGAVLLRHRRHG